MTNDTARVLRVREGKQRGWFITLSNGRTYTTNDMWIASLCTRAHELQLAIEFQDGGGWHYRELRFVQLPDGTSSKQMNAPLPKGA